MKKVLLLLVLSFLTTVLFANGLSLNSPGPRALSMGGAFIGLANDGSAIYWNPAGLAGQSSAVKLIITDVVPFGSYKLDRPEWGPSNPEIDANTEVNNYFNPNLFANFSKGNLAFGLGIFVPAGLGAEYDGKDLKNLSGGEELDWMSKIAVINFAPAIAYQFSDKFSAGVAFNLYYGMFNMDRPAVNANVGAFQYTEESTGMGYGASLGVLYHASKAVSLGLTVRTSTKVTMDGTAENGLFGAIGAAEESDFDRDVTWPLWIGGGLAFHPSEKFTITLDAQFSRWSELESLKTEFDDEVWAENTEATGDDTFHLNWSDATQLRLGWEYLATQCLAIRGGYYYDPAPAPEETLNILFPSSTNSVVTFGFGYNKAKFDLDFGVEYLFGVERNAAAYEHNMPGSHELDVFAFSIGLAYKL